MYIARLIQCPALSLSGFLVALVMMSGRTLAGDPSPVPTDLTNGGVIERSSTYNLGATGLRGYIYTRAANMHDCVQGRTTTASRQILVSHVGAKSPADGVMQVDDVIVGAGGKLFTDDARKSIALAIQEAEKEQNMGILKLTRWRGGTTAEVQLKLQVMGVYSATAPYNCPKSQRIFVAACKALEKEPLANDLWGAINGLALLATGNPNYLPKVQELARKMGPSTLKFASGQPSAWAGYQSIFLCEYYLRTGDKEVLSAIAEYTLAFAKGQGLYGTFGHGFSELTANGKLHGSIPPYGPVNAAGLVTNMAIVMGKKCGVKDSEIDAAIMRASNFFGYYVDKGAIPYGEHEPWPYHENNGKTAMTAMLFGLQGNRPREAQFFARMATAGYNNREYGHTGQGFSYLWGALGASVGGPSAASAFFKQASWHLDLARRCDGSFTYDGSEQYGGGNTGDNTYYGTSGYYGLSPNACYVLTYALPLKKLCITGKDANTAYALSLQEVEQTIASGRFDMDSKKMTPLQLVAAFRDWSPIARSWAAAELATRPEAKAMVPELLKMAEGQDAHVRQGACETLGYLKAPEALPVFARLLVHSDRWLRYKAAAAIKEMGGAASAIAADALKALAKTAEPLQPISWADPLQLAQGQLAEALFYGPIASGLNAVDPNVVYPAIRAVSTNAGGMARMRLKGYFENRLTLEDVRALAPDLLAASESRAPADTMFCQEIRMGAVAALSKYHFQEGIRALALLLKNINGHGSDTRIPILLKQITSYGSAAKVVVPDLKEFITIIRNGEVPNHPVNLKKVSDTEAAIKAIEAATTQPELRSIKK